MLRSSSENLEDLAVPVKSAADPGIVQGCCDPKARETGTKQQTDQRVRPLAQLSPVK